MLLLARAAAMAVSAAVLETLPTVLGPLAALIYALNLAVLVSCSRSLHTTERSIDLPAPVAVDDDNAFGLTEMERLMPDISIGGRSMVQHCIHTLVTVYNEYLGCTAFRLSFVICFFKILGLDVQLIQTQWSVKRFMWAFSTATYVNAYAAIICVCVLLGLPVITSCLLKKLKSTRKVETSIFRLSLFFRILGTFAMALSPNEPCFLFSVGVQALGAGTYDTFKAIVTGFASTKHIAELYAVIGMVETIAHMIGSQIWANVLIASLAKGRLGMGLPFLLSASFSFCALLLSQSLFLRVGELDERSPS